MSCRKYCNLCSCDFDTMHVLHFVISGHEHPAVLITKADNLRIFYVLANAAARIHKPLGKSLDCKPGRPERTATDLAEKPSSRKRATNSSRRFLTYVANVGQRLVYHFAFKPVILCNFSCARSGSFPTPEQGNRYTGACNNQAPGHDVWIHGHRTGSRDRWPRSAREK